jgi:hypothetical protein
VESELILLAAQSDIDISTPVDGVNSSRSTERMSLAYPSGRLALSFDKMRQANQISLSPPIDRVNLNSDTERMGERKLTLLRGWRCL